MNKIAELQALINSYLNECDTILTPTICQMKATPEGRKQIEESIISRIVQKGITVGQAINEIEREYNPNLIND